MKDVGLRIRVQRDLRDAFLAACRKEDKPAAQVLREFMRSYIEESGGIPLEGTDVTEVEKSRK